MRSVGIRCPAMLTLIVFMASGVSCLHAADFDLYQVGLAKVDVTPDYPVRLNGFGFRRDESEGVSQRLFARAMAISQGQQSPLVVLAVDNLGLRLEQVDEVARRLKESHGLPRENFALTFTHTHCAPKVSGASDNIFSQPIPEAHLEHIDRYTSEIVDRITDAARQAIDSRQASTLAWSVGSVDFAKNRRTAGGPVDHDLPTLIVRDSNSEVVRGVWVSYACHCVTLRFNQLSGDWAGYAAEMIERQYPGAVALVSIGAGSDQNPNEVTPDDTQIARRQGTQIASEVARLVDGDHRRLSGATQATLERIELPLNTLPTREQLVETAANGKRPTDRHNAQTQLDRLDRGEKLLAAIDYPIQVWSFGESHCLTFLGGEVCVDYSLRMKQEFDAERVWLITYSNDFCSYIPSERLVGEGGYGGGAEVPYFALPTTLAAGLEQRIFDQVHHQVPKPFVVPSGVRGIAPKSPEDSLECMRTSDQLRIELAASEPQLRDPVAIDFGLDGCLWVAEMSNYGRGVYEQFDQTGRIRCLRDQDGDGSYESASTFVDGLRFPTDVKVWRDGLLICDAPEILLVRDSDGDGKADVRETLFSGFEVRNAQARVNSLRWGLDNWIYGSCGLFGGEIHSHRTGKTTSLVGRDFRLNPDTGEIEGVLGRTQQGRARNDWGDWFGCSNGNLLRYYGGDDRYTSRNRHVSTPTLGLGGEANAFRLFPPEKLVRFELSGAPGAATSACGMGIYRDVAIGAQYLGDAFTCEPVHQLVHRIKLRPDSLGYVAARGEGEEDSEFLTSTDRWFRPVQARTGLDGALWVVDMYRFVIEHPRWIPQASLAELDLFAGKDLGRIYRVAPAIEDRDPEAFDLSSQSNEQLVGQLRSTNGPLRDLAHQMLIWRDAGDAVPLLRDLVCDQSPAVSKLHALAILDALGGIGPELLIDALKNEHPEVIRHAVRWSEPFLDDQSELRDAVIDLHAHDHPRVRRQVAWTLGECEHPETVPALAKLAARSEPETLVRSAVLSSIRTENGLPLLRRYMSQPRIEQVPAISRQLVTSVIRLGRTEETAEAIRLVVTGDKASDDETFLLLSAALDAADARIGTAKIDIDSELRRRVVELHAAALRNLSNSSLELLGRYRGTVTQHLLDSDQPTVTMTQVVAAIADLITARESVDRQLVAIEALARSRQSEVASLLIDRYHSVDLKSQAAILNHLLRRQQWSAELLRRIVSGELRSSLLDANRRASLLSHPDQSIRALAAEAFASDQSASRRGVIEAYRSALELKGDQERGRGHFRKHCASCHKLEGYGHVVGPDLNGLTNRDPEWLLTTILDPNRDVDARYVSWSALTADGQLIAGLVVDQSASMVQLRESGGKEHRLLREDLDQFRASDQSLMPEGFEKELKPQDIGDLLAYLTTVIGDAKPVDDDAPLPRYAPQIAPFLLDESQSVERRRLVIDRRPGMGPAIVSLLVHDLQPGDEPAQYQRIPWIWRVSLAVGRRNDGGEIRDLLERSLPQPDAPLEHWQAVAIGGGIINGLSLSGEWPGRRIDDILNGAPALRPRWQRALKLSMSMADDEQVRGGTRYDALRMIALADPEAAIPHLKRYLREGIDRELQMGAVSGLADIDSQQVPQSLIESLAHLERRNRKLAIEALLRTESRTDALITALAQGDARVVIEEIQSQRSHSIPAVTENAARALESMQQSDQNGN